MNLRWALVGALLVTTACAARADRDIVFSAQFYRWGNTYYRGPYGGKPQRQLDQRGCSHLYRINPDGSGLRQITHGDRDDIGPVWSPDGKQILFARYVGERQVLCISDESGHHVRRLTSGEHDESPYAGYTWAPDGKRIAACCSDYANDRFKVVVLNARTGYPHSYPGRRGFAWAPDGSRMLLWGSAKDRGDLPVIVRIDGGPTQQLTFWMRWGGWLDNETIAGIDPFPTQDTVDNRVRIWSASGGLVREVEMRGARQRPGEAFELPFQGQTWLRLPGHPNELLVDAYDGKSDGHHYECTVVNVKTGQARPLIEGMLAGISPDGRRIAAATAEWVGPYKRGGARCGPLEIVDIASGRRRAITSRLVSIAGGDWRRAPRKQ